MVVGVVTKEGGGSGGKCKSNGCIGTGVVVVVIVGIVVVVVVVVVMTEARNGTFFMTMH